MYSNASSLVEGRPLAGGNISGWSKATQNLQNEKMKHLKSGGGVGCKTSDGESMTKYTKEKHQGVLVDTACNNKEQSHIYFDGVHACRKETTIQTQNTRNKIQSNHEEGVVRPLYKPYSQDQAFYQNGKFDSITENCAPSKMAYAENKSLVVKVNGRTSNGSRQLGLSSVQSLEKVVDNNGSKSGKTVEVRPNVSKLWKIGDINPNGLESGKITEVRRKTDSEGSVARSGNVAGTEVTQPNIHARLTSIYSKVLVVNSISAAKKVVQMLTDQYRHLVHACDTEVCYLLQS